MELTVAGRDIRLVIEDPALAPDLLGGLVRGSELPPGPGRPEPVGRFRLAVVGGLDAGRGVDAGPGAEIVVGRSAACDLAPVDATVSRRHARLTIGADGDVTVADLGARNGTWLVGSGAGEVAVGPGASVALAPTATVRLGATEMAVTEAIDDAPVAGPTAPRRSLSGTTPFNRPPRPAPPPPPGPVAVPEAPRPTGSSTALGVVTVLAPIAMAAALVVVMGNPVFALFALLSPVVAVGNHVESKRRTRRTTRRDAARWAAELDEFTEALTSAVEVEVARRRAGAPDPAEVLRRAEQPSTRLWERRLTHDDARLVRVGVGDVAWDPPLAGDRHPRPAEVAELVAAAATLPRCPATVDLGVIGVVGPRSAALAVARSLLCQATVHAGPADLPVLVAVDDDAAPSWDWAKWLPHVEDVTGTGRRLAVGREAADALSTALRADESSGPPPLVVVDGDALLEGRRAPVRSLLAGRAAGIVVSGAVGRLPAACTAVVVVDDDGVAELQVPALGRRLAGLRAAGMADDTARRCARALARFDDPELDAAGAGLPDVVRLPPLLGLDRVDAAAVGARWRAGGNDPRPTTPIGVAVDGIVDVDLVADGPHGLVAGTTGAGKSELLRTLVAGLAAGSSPDDLTFVLVDFKGGSAFDACARLPHVVGFVTDLDDELAERALRCLDAEVRHRERLLRNAGAADLAGYRLGGGRPPLPRLVVVVDEFATLKAELPDFVKSLIGVAQRGRSLGVHLVLATQRPSGAVSDDIRANTALRIALRVHDAGDSADVVEVPDAASLPRHRPGRACVRLGPGEIVTVQTALTTAPAATGRRRPLRLEPFRFGPGIEPAPAAMAIANGRGRTDLDALVDACIAAWAATGRPAPRRPWPDPLPPALDRAGLPAGAVALADDPDHQVQVPLGWQPAEGNLAIYGAGGSGTTTTLVASALALADDVPPDRLHLYAVDHGAGELAVLAALPHVGGVLVATERERQWRLIRWLRRELDRRRSSTDRGDEPAVVVLIDGVAAFLAQFDDVAGLEVLDAFERVFADGPEVGLHVAVTADRAGALPSSLAALVRQRWVHRLADPLDAGAAGVAGRPPALVPGRFVDTVSGLVAHVARPGEGWSAAVAACATRWSAVGATASAPPIGELPAALCRSALDLDVELGTGRWILPVGVADDDLAPAAIELWDGEHALVAGPNRAGRTTALATLAAAAVEAGARVLVVAGRRSWLPTIAGVEAVAVVDLGTLGDGRPTLVVVDDAEAVDDDSGMLERLVAASPAGVHVVAAGRAESLRGLYGHWTRTLRRSRVGLLLRPHLDLDGELLGTPLPRRVGVPLVAGRGFLVADGAARLVQVALPA